MIMEGDARGLSWLRRTVSFAQSRIILTANNLRIFDILGGSTKTAASLARKLKTDTRATEILLDSLAAIGLLTKTGGRYTNGHIAERYLVAGAPEYQGDILRHYSILWDNWSGLDEVMKSGMPAGKTRSLDSFILGMHNLASLKVDKVLRRIPLKGVRKALDLGGGPGTYAMALARTGIDVTLMDFPETLKIARKVIDGAKLADSVHLLPGDFTEDPWGEGYDLILVSQILHAYDPPSCLSILRKGFAALNKGGVVAVHEFFLDDTRTAPLTGALFSVNMLVNTDGGRTYTNAEIGKMVKKAGFGDITSKRLDDTVVVTGRKR